MVHSESTREYNSYLGKDLSTLLILSTLSAKKRSSTYELIRDIKIKTKDKISLRAGTIYPHMVKLESMGVIYKSIEDTPSRSEGVIRQKSVYSITQKGLEMLKKKKRDWNDLQFIIDSLLENET
ncbi:MAG: PadR family transcriptional regulator [Candidatus Hodarchaeales archaeon]|jgi:DNA-binding PadR family transcriptional regulator